MTHPFSGKVALVTGAGRGIGRALALGLVDGGASVALLARSHDELDDVAGVVGERGGTALVVRADVGALEQVADAVARASAEFGAVDILVNNAAVVAPLGPTVGLDPAGWSVAIATNVVGPIAFTTALLPGMLERGWGRIVNVSSGIVAHPAAMIGANAYVTTKAALEAHTLNLAAEVADTGVTVNVYRPGSVDTAMQGWIRDQSPNEIGAELHDRFVTSHEAGSLITPERSAASLLTHLAGDATGEIWDVDDE